MVTYIEDYFVLLTCEDGWVMVTVAATEFRMSVSTAFNFS